MPDEAENIHPWLSPILEWNQAFEAAEIPASSAGSLPLAIDADAIGEPCSPVRPHFCLVAEATVSQILSVIGIYD